MPRLLCLFLLVYLNFSSSSTAAPLPGSGTIPPLSYTHDGLEVTITDCDASYSGALTVPPLIENLPVAIVGDSAFENCVNITELALPDSINHIETDGFKGCTGLTQLSVPANLNSIGNQAFRDCRRLEAIVIPEGTTQIGDRAFERCIALDSASLPNSLTAIGDFAFKDCIELNTIILPENLSALGIGAFNTCIQLQAIGLEAANSHYTTINGVLFDAPATTLLAFPAARDGSYNIPAGVSSIRAWAFSGAIFLDQINFPSSLTTLGEGSFNDCLELSSIALPSGVTSLPDFCFNNCSSLQTLTLPDTISTINPGALRSTGALRQIDVSPANTRYSAPTGVLFDDDLAMLVRYPPQRRGTGYVIPSGIVTIEEHAFEGNTHLDRIFLPDGLTTIGLRAFGDCEQLATIAIPSSVSSVGAFAFADCSALTAIYFLGNAPADIKYQAFGNSSELTAYHFESATGFTLPTWSYDFSGTTIDSADLASATRSPFLEWKLRTGYRHDRPSRAEPLHRVRARGICTRTRADRLCESSHP